MANLYKYKITKRTSDDSGEVLVSKMGSKTPKPPAWFSFWSEQKFEPLVEKVDKIEKRMDNLETKVDKIEKRMDNLETKVDKIEKRMDNLETKVDKIEKRMDNVIQLNNLKE